MYKDKQIYFGGLMKYDFTYYNPTKIHFGKDALNKLAGELVAYGENVLLVYGKGSVKRTGIYDKVVKILTDANKRVTELEGIKPNPSYSQVLEGARLVRENKVDLILAVGGGSVIDYAKGVSVSVHCKEDFWDKYYLRMEDPDCEIVPVGAVLTMVGTGSEMNGGSVITNPAQKLKIGKVFGEEVFPKFAILNPEYTFTLPKYQMIAGFFDILCHIHEQYFSGTDDNTSDYVMEGLMHSLIHSANIAVEDPKNYEARSNIMWTATWALNTFVAMGKDTDWEVHMIGQAVGAYTDATHGMTLAAVTPAYMRHILPYGLKKMARYAVNVWGVDPNGKSEEQTAKEGLAALEKWMRAIGLVMDLKTLGVTEDMIPGIADSTYIMQGGYKVLTKEEVIEILRESL